MKNKLQLNRIGKVILILAIATLASAAIIGVLILNEWLPEARAEVALKCVMICAIFYASWWTSKKSGKLRMQTAAVVGLAYLVLCYAAGIILFPKADGKIGLWIVLVILISSLGGIVSTIRKTRKR